MRLLPDKSGDPARAGVTCEVVFVTGELILLPGKSGDPADEMEVSTMVVAVCVEVSDSAGD